MRVGPWASRLANGFQQRRCHRIGGGMIGEHDELQHRVEAFEFIDGGFDADVALFTGELRLLIPELMAALGGLQTRPAAALPPPPADAASVAPWDSVPA
jgi:hypothetical protein